jgi:hypothetical protein
MGYQEHSSCGCSDLLGPKGPLSFLLTWLSSSADDSDPWVVLPILGVRLSKTANFFLNMFTLSESGFPLPLPVQEENIQNAHSLPWVTGKLFSPSSHSFALPYPHSPQACCPLWPGFT